MSKWSAAHGREKRSMLCHVSPVHIPSHNPNLSENEVHFKNSRRRRRDFGVSWSVLSWASLCSERANLWVKRLIFWILEGCLLRAVAANFLLAVQKKRCRRFVRTMARRWKHGYTTAAACRRAKPRFFFSPAPLTQMISCWRVQSSLCTIHVSHFVLWETITAVFPHSPCPLLSCPFLLLYNYVRVPLIHPLSAEAHRPTFMSGFFSLSYGGGARCVFRLILAATRSTVLQFPAWQKKKPEGKVIQPQCWEEREAQSQNVLEWLFAV